MHKIIQADAEINSQQAPASSKSKVGERIRKMKSYNHLYEKMIESSNIELAIKESAKGKRDRKEVKRTLSNMVGAMAYYRERVKDFKSPMHRPKIIYDGIRHKVRKILVPRYEEQVIHHMVVNVLKPIFMKGMYEHSYGSIPKRGSVLAKSYIEKWLKHDTKNTRYCLQIDVQKFFDSIPHDVLKTKLAETIHDAKFLKVLYEIIDVQEIGLPLGFYTSQWLANWYLTPLDHYIKEVLRADYFVRYMDDMIVLDSNKKILYKMKNGISEYLKKELGLNLKDNWLIFPIEYVDKNGRTRGRAIDFMGYKFYRNRTTLRKTIMLRMVRTARKLSKKAKKTIYDCRRMLSYLGWICWTDTYGMYEKWIKPYVNFQELKRRISRYDRRMAYVAKI